MIRQYSILIFLLLFSFILFAEDFHLSEKQSSVSGTVLDEENNPVAYAAVALFFNSDSSIAGGAATDEAGYFKIATIPGNYFLKINFLSFEEKIIPGIQLSGDPIDLGTITLKAGTIAMDEVAIQGEKSQMSLQLDKRVFNVGKDISNKGGNAADVLENVPSVGVDIDGNVSLRGSQNVRILIDGKPSGLTGLSSTDALRLLQANMIESIEVITNPSSRYDAEGEVGIINIVLKKERQKGVNGSFDFSVGYPHNYSAAYNLNFRKNWINLFSSYSIHYKRNPGYGFTKQTYTGEDTSYSYNSTRHHERGGLGNTIRLGSDFFLNDQNTLTFAGLYRYSRGNNEAMLQYDDLDQNGTIMQTVTREEEEKETKQNIELSLNYRKTFEKKGQLLTADVQWFRSDDTELSDILEQNITLPGTPIDQRSSNTEDELNWLGQVDYTHPFREEGKFETGIKGTFRTIENDYSVEQLSNGDEWEVLPDFDDHFIYHENIYAAYAMIGDKIKDFSWQAGVRAEYSDINTQLIETDTTDTRGYIDFFPSVHLSYDLKKDNTLQISYSRRLSRPHFRWLLPFSSYSDSRNIRRGNPDLNPEYTNSIEVGHLKYWDKGSLLSSIYYRHRTGVIERIITADPSGLTRTLPVNLSTQHAVGLEFNVNYKILDWWSMNGSANIYREVTDGSYEGQDLHSETFSWMTQVSSKMTFFKRLDFQVSFNYRGPKNDSQGKRKAVYTLDSGLSMDVLKGKGTLTLSGKDLLNSRKRRSITDTEDLYSESEFQWRSRQVLLSFNYRLNQKKKGSGRQGGGGFDSGDDF